MSHWLLVVLTATHSVTNRRRSGTSCCNSDDHHHYHHCGGQETQVYVNYYVHCIKASNYILFCLQLIKMMMTLHRSLL